MCLISILEIIVIIILSKLAVLLLYLVENVTLKLGIILWHI